MTNKFGAYVQSIAFNMTLSRNMIEALGLIRDHGKLHADHGIDISARVNSYSVPIGRSLERRGLVEHWSTTHPHLQNKREWESKIPFVWRLTRAGALTCDLLVEADLLPAAQTAKKGKAA